MINEYDELKSLLKKSKMLMEQKGPINMGKSIEDNIEDDENDYSGENQTSDYNPKKDKSKTYRISGGLLTLNGKDKKDIELTSEEKTAFQETMDEFVTDVSDLSDFGILNVYENSVEWSGKILDADIEFFYTIGEETGVYVNGDMIKLDEKLVELINKLTSFYEKFKSKWAKVISIRKKTIDKKM
jgi:hypothetical protein